jgi:prepilin-type N-terminal cleavage/methylation domain-containing protein
MTKKKNNKGFTLLELIIVLFLMTLILGLSAVLFANALPSNKFNATVRSISTTIRQARTLAQIHGERQTVTIDLDAKQYGVTGHELKSIPSDIYVKVIDPISGELQTGKYYFVVQAGGSIEGGTVILWNSKRQASIQADPVVGSVVIK